MGVWLAALPASRESGVQPCLWGQEIRVPSMFSRAEVRPLKCHVARGSPIYQQDRLACLSLPFPACLFREAEQS